MLSWFIRDLLKSAWGWTSLVVLDKNWPANAGDRVSIPGPGRFTCHRVTEPMRHNYGALTLQLLKPVHLELVLCSSRDATAMRSPCTKRVAPAHLN